jgi:hypothetical protein
MTYFLSFHPIFSVSLASGKDLMKIGYIRRSAASSGWVKSGVDYIAWHSLGGGVRSTWDKVKEGLNEVSNC